MAVTKSFAAVNARSGKGLRKLCSPAISYNSKILITLNRGIQPNVFSKLCCKIFRNQALNVDYSPVY
jgi:hypothetical protein